MSLSLLGLYIYNLTHGKMVVAKEFVLHPNSQGALYKVSAKSI